MVHDELLAAAKEVLRYLDPNPSDNTGEWFKDSKGLFEYIKSAIEAEEKRQQDASQDEGVIISKIIANLATATGTPIDKAAYAISHCSNYSKYISVVRAVAVYYKDSNHELGEMARAALGLTGKGGK